MKRLMTAILAGGAVALFSIGTASAADATYRDMSRYGLGGGHGRQHDELEHRGVHRELSHRQAHRGPITSWQRGRMHDQLNHETYHDRRDHRSYHRTYAPHYGRFGTGGYGDRHPPGFGYQAPHYRHGSGSAIDWLAR